MMSPKFRARSRARTQVLDREPIWASGWLAILVIAAAMAATQAKALESASESPRSGSPAVRVAPAAEIFRDEFQGNALAQHWLVTANDVRRHLVSEGALRLSTDGEADSTATTGDRIRLSEPLPASDWAVTVNLQLTFGTGAELFDLVVESDEMHWIGVRLRASPNKYSGHRLMLGIVESDDGVLRGREEPLVEIECNVCASAWSWQGFSRQLVDARKLVLRIEKRGQEFLASAQLGSGDAVRRVAVGPLRSRIEARELAVEFAQCNQPDVRQGADPLGTSSVAIESVAVEVAGGATLVASDPRSGKATAN